MIETSRHRDYFNPRNYDDRRITIIGAGATGSRVFEALVNLGLTNITVYDYDHIEEHNLANQIYSARDIGRFKVAALENWWYQKVKGQLDVDSSGGKPTELNFINKKVGSNMKSDMGNIVFLLTDTMESRREIWKNSLWLNPHVQTVFETRMALTHGDIYQFNPNVASDNREWNATLIDDEEAEVSACGTALSVGTTASIIANMCVSQMMHYLKDEPVPNHTSIYLHPLIITDEEWGKKEVA